MDLSAQISHLFGAPLLALKKINSLLEHDHEEIGEVVSDLLTAIDGSSVEESFRLLDLFWARLAVHIRAEHLHLFPTILNELDSSRKDETNNTLSLDEARKAIAQLRTDHDFFMHELASAIKQMRDFLAKPEPFPDPNMLQGIRAIVEAVRGRLEAHNKLEEERVYRWVDEVLNPEKQIRLVAKLKHEIENLPPRYLEAGAADGKGV